MVRTEPGSGDVGGMAKRRAMRGRSGCAELRFGSQWQVPPNRRKGLHETPKSEKPAPDAVLTKRPDLAPACRQSAVRSTANRRAMSPQPPVSRCAARRPRAALQRSPGPGCRAASRRTERRHLLQQQQRDAGWHLTRPRHQHIPDSPPPRLPGPRTPPNDVPSSPLQPRHGRAGVAH
jgi:hypothetical protein